MLTALIQSAAVVVLPYDSTDQVTSGVLVDAVASGRPVVATPILHMILARCPSPGTAPLLLHVDWSTDSAGESVCR